MIERSDSREEPIPSPSLNQGARGGDKAPLIRHLALCGATILVFLLRESPGIEDEVLWVVIGAAVLNLAATIGWRHPRPEPVGRSLSSALGLASWSALAALTGGLTSPLIAGLWLEIVLAALDGPPAGITLATAGAVAGLWVQQSLLGLDGLLTRAALLTGFLLLSGALTFRVARRWAWSETGMACQIGALREQLARLEAELAPPRDGGGDAAEAARLAHGLKNTVHSMRGLVELIQPHLRVSARSQSLLDGLRFAIDSLEQTARITLGPAGPRDLTTRDIREVIRQVATAFPGVTWRLSLDASWSAPGPTPLLCDALANVLRNAAEAMHGQGEICVDAAPKDGRLEIRVRDHGPGISSERVPLLFKPGYTTKQGGHGLGLLLARQHVEGGGGRLTLTPAEGGGMLCSLELPLPGSRTKLAGAGG